MAQLKSDRTSCSSANANQMRLILHTADYWLMWKVRQAMPVTAALRDAEFAILCLKLIKVAARVVETASRIRFAFASVCPDAELYRDLAEHRQPLNGAGMPPANPSTFTPAFKPAMKQASQGTVSASTRQAMTSRRQDQRTSLVNKDG